MYTTSAAILDALHEAGVSFIFANLGSDHPAFLEALASARSAGRPMPRLITCPNEMVALSAAHGFAQVTGQAQAVLVHVECGTQSLGGAVHNAAKGRVPVLIFAGQSPLTQHGELRGSRNEFIHWIQDVFDQHGIVRGYVKYNYDIRTGANVKQIIHRAMQFAHSDPPGPVYLTAAREVLEFDAPEGAVDGTYYAPIEPSALPASAVGQIVDVLLAAHRPLIITSSLGRKPAAVAELTHFCERAAVGVLESVPSCMNFPANHPMYQGNQGNEQRQNPVLADADVILVMDSDVPWIPTVNRPNPAARIFHIDVDPLKEQMPLWHIPAVRSYRADGATALGQLNAYLDSRMFEAEQRRVHFTIQHEALGRELAAKERLQADGITPEFLTAAVREAAGAGTIFLNEGITNYKAITDHLYASEPGSLFASGGGSLGWNGGAAIGMKLACPEKTIVSLTGDGSYMFSQPSSVHWMARRYDTPFVQVIYNNRGWRAPKYSMLAVHPEGFASRADDIGVTFDPSPDYGGIAAAAGGALALKVEMPGDLQAALAIAFKAVHEERRCAVVDVWLPRL